MIPHDYHTHTNFSCDGKATMAEMCRAAVERGVPEIGFTEHYDLHPLESCRDWFRLDEWAAELERCRAVYRPNRTLNFYVAEREGHDDYVISLALVVAAAAAGAPRRARGWQRRDEG